MAHTMKLTANQFLSKYKFPLLDTDTCIEDAIEVFSKHQKILAIPYVSYEMSREIALKYPATALKKYSHIFNTVDLDAMAEKDPESALDNCPRLLSKEVLQKLCVEDPLYAISRAMVLDWAHLISDDTLLRCVKSDRCLIAGEVIASNMYDRLEKAEPGITKMLYDEGFKRNQFSYWIRKSK
jgi:hypothetical protein